MDEYDSDKLDARLSEKGGEMIAPHRTGRVKPKTQDGRKPGRYKRRWKIERFIAWQVNDRRCIVRHENKEQNFSAVVLLACMRMVLKPLLPFMRLLVEESLGLHINANWFNS